MKKIKTIIIAMLTLISVNAMSQIHTESIEYKDGSTTLKGYITYDESSKDVRPGILVVHEWWGLNDYTKMRCGMLAKLGYFAFAADIYGDGFQTTAMEEAGKHAGTFRNDRLLMRKRINLALDELKKQKLVNPDKIAAIGYCFGGTVALELARSGADIKGIVSFHGGLDTPDPADAKNIKAKILVLTGGDDPNVKDEQVENFKKEMRDAGVDYEICIYGGAVHAFTNPNAGSDNSRGMAYNEKADKRSWEAMKSFFNEIFK
jgi:dienelactone hydrolase